MCGGAGQAGWGKRGGGSGAAGAGQAIPRRRRNAGRGGVTQDDRTRRIGAGAAIWLPPS